MPGGIWMVHVVFPGRMVALILDTESISIGRGRSGGGVTEGVKRKRSQRDSERRAQIVSVRVRGQRRGRGEVAGAGRISGSVGLSWRKRGVRGVEREEEDISIRAC